MAAIFLKRSLSLPVAPLKSSLLSVSPIKSSLLSFCTDSGEEEEVHVLRGMKDKENPKVHRPETVDEELKEMHKQLFHEYLDQLNPVHAARKQLEAQIRDKQLGLNVFLHHLQELSNLLEEGFSYTDMFDVTDDADLLKNLREGSDLIEKMIGNYQDDLLLAGNKIANLVSSLRYAFVAPIESGKSKGMKYMRKSLKREKVPTL